LNHLIHYDIQSITATIRYQDITIVHLSYDFYNRVESYGGTDVFVRMYREYRGLNDCVCIDLD